MKFKIIIILSFIFSLSGYAQQDTTSFIYQRTYNRLKEKGLTDLEIKEEINSIYNQANQVSEREGLAYLNEINQNYHAARLANNNCQDIPVYEKEVLLNLYNNLNLSSWANNTWDFSGPVTSWDESTQTGWKGISIQNCRVYGIIIVGQGISGSIPDLSPLSELVALTISPTNFYTGTFYTHNYYINSNSNFASIGNLTKLVRLRINNADFGGALPNNFINLSSKITYFSLADCNLNNLNQLETIVSSYTKLTYLDLGVNFDNNNVPDFPLPITFSNLIDLENLIFWSSKVNNVDVISSLTKLRFINLQLNNINQLIPNLANHNNLNYLMLSENQFYGEIPSYFQNINFGWLRLSNNKLSGLVPSLNFNFISNDNFYINNNYFRFNDFRTNFNSYNTNITDFYYSPQAKTDDESTINKLVGEQVTMRMFEDGNHHSGDTYKWYKDNQEIVGAYQREYTFTVTQSSGGVYHCRAQHWNPPITNSSTDPYKNLTLFRNNITLNVSDECISCTSFELLVGEKYVISGWVKEAPVTGIKNNNVYKYENSAIEVSFLDVSGNVINTSLNFLPVGDIIDGWQLIKGEFIVPANVDDMKIELVNNNSSLNSFFDDIRVHPFNGNLKSFVYDQGTQKLMAELDENNYATFYEYDKEGGLVRVKKETEKGIFTIQETRSSTPKKD